MNHQNNKYLEELFKQGEFINVTLTSEDGQLHQNQESTVIWGNIVISVDSIKDTKVIRIVILFR